MKKCYMALLLLLSWMFLSSSAKDDSNEKRIYKNILEEEFPDLFLYKRQFEDENSLYDDEADYDPVEEDETIKKRNYLRRVHKLGHSGKRQIHPYLSEDNPVVIPESVNENTDTYRLPSVTDSYPMDLADSLDEAISLPSNTPSTLSEDPLLSTSDYPNVLNPEASAASIEPEEKEVLIEVEEPLIKPSVAFTVKPQEFPSLVEEPPIKPSIAVTVKPQTFPSHVEEPPTKPSVTVTIKPEEFPNHVEEPLIKPSVAVTVKPQVYPSLSEVPPSTGGNTQQPHPTHPISQQTHPTHPIAQQAHPTHPIAQQAHHQPTAPNPAPQQPHTGAAGTNMMTASHSPAGQAATQTHQAQTKPPSQLSQDSTNGGASPEDVTTIEIELACGSCGNACPPECSQDNTTMSPSVAKEIKHDCCPSSFIFNSESFPPCPHVDTSHCQHNDEEYQKHNEMYYILEVGLARDYDPLLLVPSSEEFQNLNRKIQLFIVSVYHDYAYYHESTLKSIRNSQDYLTATVFVRFTKQMHGNIHLLYKAIKCHCAAGFFLTEKLRLTPANASDLFAICPPECLVPSTNLPYCPQECNDVQHNYLLQKVAGFGEIAPVQQASPVGMAPSESSFQPYQYSLPQTVCPYGCPQICAPLCAAECCYNMNYLGYRRATIQRKSKAAPTNPSTITKKKGANQRSRGPKKTHQVSI